MEELFSYERLKLIQIKVFVKTIKYFNLYHIQDVNFYFPRLMVSSVHDLYLICDQSETLEDYL